MITTALFVFWVFNKYAFSSRSIFAIYWERPEKKIVYSHYPLGDVLYLILVLFFFSIFFFIYLFTYTMPLHSCFRRPEAYVFQGISCESTPLWHHVLCFLSTTVIVKRLNKIRDGTLLCCDEKKKVIAACKQID